MGGEVRTVGQVRKSLKSNRFVVLKKLKVRTAPHRVGTRTWDMWVVSDILIGGQFEISPKDLGPVASEMEVLAWAAK